MTNKNIIKTKSERLRYIEFNERVLNELGKVLAKEKDLTLTQEYGCFNYLAKIKKFLCFPYNQNIFEIDTDDKKQKITFYPNNKTLRIAEVVAEKFLRDFPKYKIELREIEG